MSNLVYPNVPTATVRLVPIFSTIVKEYTGGQEQRDARYLAPRFRIELTYEPLVLGATWDQLFQHFVRHRGRYESFLFQDYTADPARGWAAKNRTSEQLGVGNGVETEFFLYENKLDAAAVYKDGVLQLQGATPQVVVDLATGKVTFTTAPASSAVITADVTNAYFRVRFDHDEAEFDRERGAGWRFPIRLMQVQRV